MRGLAIGLAVALILAAVPAQTKAAEPVEWRLQAGATPPAPNEVKPFEYTRFYPVTTAERPFEVHRGDVVRWNFKGFHSVAFLPGDDPSAHPPLARADELPGSLALGEGWAFQQPRNAGCGREFQPPCVLSETTLGTLLSSGTPLQASAPFLVRADLSSGTTVRYHCTVHPSMHGWVKVADDATPLRTQADVNQTIRDQVAADTAAALALEAGLSEPRSEPAPGGRTLWQVLAGASTADNGVALLEFLPAALSIRRGDEVRWTIPGPLDEIHTVTFPHPGVNAFAATAFVPGCELDDPATGLPAIPSTACPSQSQREFRFAPTTSDPQRAPADAVLTPATLHNSGTLVPASAPEFMRGRPPGSGAAFPSAFDAAFPLPGEFAYVCAIHGIPMTGGLTVG